MFLNELAKVCEFSEKGGVITMDITDEGAILVGTNNGEIHLKDDWSVEFIPVV